MKWFFWGICALISVALVRTLGDLGDSKALPEHEANSVPITRSSSEQELLAENLRLREQIIQLDKQIAQLKFSANANHPSQQLAAISQASSESIELVNIQAKVQEFNNFLVGNDSIAALKTSFTNEAVDSSWADIHKRELEDFFKNSFTEVFPQYIECRSKRCKITVPVSDQNKFSELSQALTQNILNNKEGIAKKIVIEPIENDGTLNFYVARNDDISFLE